jgi:hypothetical protein
LLAWAIAFIAALLAPSFAAAAPWREYRYGGFAVRFPSEPTVENGTYATDEGTSVNARIYSAREAGALYKVTVADFSGVRMNEAQVLSEAVAQLAAAGDVIVDVPHRVNRVLGRQLSVAGHDGSRSAFAVFYRNRSLYLVEGTILPTSEDPGSSDGVRFQQSLRFILNSARGDFLCEFRRAPRNLVDETR